MVKIVRRRILAVIAALVPVLAFRRSAARPAVPDQPTSSAAVNIADGAAAEGMMAPHEVAAKLAAMFDPRGVGAQRRAAAGERPRLGDA